MLHGYDNHHCLRFPVGLGDEFANDSMVSLLLEEGGGLPAAWVKIGKDAWFSLTSRWLTVADDLVCFERFQKAPGHYALEHFDRYGDEDDEDEDLYKWDLGKTLAAAAKKTRAYLIANHDMIVLTSPFPSEVLVTCRTNGKAIWLPFCARLRLQLGSLRFRCSSHRIYFPLADRIAMRDEFWLFLRHLVLFLQRLGFLDESFHPSCLVLHHHEVLLEDFAEGAQEQAGILRPIARTKRVEAAL